MQLLFYASKNEKNEKRLKDAIQSASLDGTIEHFTRLDDFRDRLRSIVEPNSIMVLAAVDRKELQKMQAFRDMLTEIYIILVLPDRRKSTIKLAHLLRPRFLSLIEDDFVDLNQIVAKMIRTPHGSAKTPITGGSALGTPGSRP
ncbi:MAG: hypothetical protein NTZ12_07090 [Candidatus Aminicenantes bacterium]|nr:hypothetical protein [Candidatus Aminicenantes bacterium]